MNPRENFGYRTCGYWPLAAIIASLSLAACPSSTPPSTAGADSGTATVSAMPSADTSADAPDTTATAAASATVSSAASSSPTAAVSGASIGSATMQADGTIVLQLRAEGPAGTVGDALFTYPKGHPRYEATLKHLGGLKPGESKPVPPWPEK